MLRDHNIEGRGKLKQGSHKKVCDPLKNAAFDILGVNKGLIRGDEAGVSPVTFVTCKVEFTYR